MSSKLENSESPPTEKGMGISIGAVSRATGIPTNTLRTWERRYGFPQPSRTAGGQRVYDPDVIDHLRVIARLLAMGHRPAQVLSAPRSQLRELGRSKTASAPAVSSHISGWLHATKELDAERLSWCFSVTYGKMDGITFLTDAVAPFLEALGDGWMREEISVFQEHFASEQLVHFLGNIWRPMVEKAGGPKALACTLPGEWHGIGLEMAITVLALSGWRVATLGRDAPIIDVVGAVQLFRPKVLLVSISAFANATHVRQQLFQLRRSLGDTSPEIVIGGAGAQEVEGFVHLRSLRDLDAWASMV